MFSLSRKDLTSLVVLAAIVLTMPIWLAPFGAAYPGLMQKFAIYAIFAIGFNILFGLTGYLSFGHAAFLGVGSYTTVVVQAADDGHPAGDDLRRHRPASFALVIGYFSLRRTGIYFSILTLAFRADVLQPRLFGADAHHQWRDRLLLPAVIRATSTRSSARR